MHTEEQAKTKWCPEARQSAKVDGAVSVANSVSMGRSLDRPEPVLMHVFCIASGCMHWRWYEAPGRGEGRLGFCGLSGRPVG